MEIQEAANQLADKLRPHPWFLTVAIGKSDLEKETLFVYVRSSKKPKLSLVDPLWQGYKVVVKHLGTIRAW
jgi:hypothetical protein